jgi:hypothetical protein
MFFTIMRVPLIAGFPEQIFGSTTMKPFMIFCLFLLKGIGYQGQNSNSE